jgi:hypothetical protein
MNEKHTGKAASLAAQPWFRWVEGMQAVWASGHIVERVDYVNDFGEAFGEEMYWREAPFPPDAVPDLEDPGTVGFLFTWLVRRQPTHWWSIGIGSDGRWHAASRADDIDGDTMGEAIANALLLVGGTP